MMTENERVRRTRNHVGNTILISSSKSANTEDGYAVVLHDARGVVIDQIVRSTWLAMSADERVECLNTLITTRADVEPVTPPRTDVEPPVQRDEPLDYIPRAHS